jgi:hypothetical protein
MTRQGYSTLAPQLHREPLPVLSGREPGDPNLIVDLHDLVPVELRQVEALRELALKYAYPIHRVESVPPVMSGAEHKVVERFYLSRRLARPMM